MTRFRVWLRRLAAFFWTPAAQWSDGVAVTDPAVLTTYAALYADVAKWVEAQRPGAVLVPEMRVTIRVFPQGLPRPHQRSDACVLAPHEITGDSGGTLCIKASVAHSDWLVSHEFIHAMTGERGHPVDLFPNG